jgi:hypothetical protein
VIRIARVNVTAYDDAARVDAVSVGALARSGAGSWCIEGDQLRRLRLCHGCGKDEQEVAGCFSHTAAVNDFIGDALVGKAEMAGRLDESSISNVALRSKTFYWLQELINNWVAVVASGQPLPI